MSAVGPAKHRIATPAARELVGDLQKCLNARMQRKGCIGVTTWLKNTARAGVPFSVSRASTARGKQGLSIGRVADHMLRKWCNDEPIQKGFARTHFDHGARALTREKLMPVAAQVPCALGPLKTEIDAICIREGKTGRVGIVVVEYKTSQQTLAQHTESYNQRCYRKPYMNVAGLENSERTGHQLQADFGAKALLHTYPHLSKYYMESVVLYATPTGAKVYPVTPFPRSTFDVRPTAPHAVVETKKSAFPLLPAAPAGGTIIREVLRRAGHSKILAGGAASCTSVRGTGVQCVVGISPTWHKLSKTKRNDLTRKLKKVANKKEAWLIGRNAKRDWVAAPLREM